MHIMQVKHSYEAYKTLQQELVTYQAFFFSYSQKIIC